MPQFTLKGNEFVKVDKVNKRKYNSSDECEEIMDKIQILYTDIVDDMEVKEILECEIISDFTNGIESTGENEININDIGCNEFVYTQNLKVKNEL